MRNPSLLKKWGRGSKRWDWWDSLTSGERESIEHQTERAASWKKKHRANCFSLLDPLKFISKDED